MPGTQHSEPINVQEHSRSYSIRKHENVYRYRVTVPKKLFDEAGIDNGDELGVRAVVSDEGYLDLLYSTNPDKYDTSVSASKHSSGELTILSAFGAAVHLDNYQLKWELEEYEGEHILRGKTDLFLQEYLLDQVNKLDVRTLKHVTQDIEYDGEDWSQEHFQLYLDVRASEELNWGDGEEVVLQIGQFEGEIILVYTPKRLMRDEYVDKNAKKVRKTGDVQRDRLLYVPNDVVRTLGFLDVELLLLDDSQTLLVVPEGTTDQDPLIEDTNRRNY